MVRQNIAAPLSVLLAGVVVIVMLLVGGGPGTSATGRAQTGYTAAELTATATALTATAYAGPSDTAEASATTSATITATTTSTVTNQATGTAATAGATPTPTLAPTATSPAALAPPTETPTATPSSELSCVPGVPVEIAGQGPPRTAYLLYFGERAVGGGTVEQDGTFLAKLVVGQERAGTYDVAVRVRGTGQLLRQVSCAVPEQTPTPIADLGFRGLR